MKSKILFLCAAGLALGLIVTYEPVFAHHGTGISYDSANPIELKGTVTEFVWKNPHCQLFFKVKDAKGGVVDWAAELNSPGVLQQQGWTRNFFKPGDEIVITVQPSKAGTPVGNTDRGKSIFINGKEAAPGRRGATTID